MRLVDSKSTVVVVDLDQPAGPFMGREFRGPAI